MMEILIYNILFWAAWYQICLLPERFMQYLIDTY